MKTILVVDDDQVSLLPLEAHLTLAGYRVVTAPNGADGVEAFQRAEPALVLMDIRMPVMDGYEATRRIKGLLPEGRTVPVLFLTGVQEEVDLARCLECGGDDFLGKPFQPVILDARLRAWLHRAELADEVATTRRCVEDVLLKMQGRRDFTGLGVRLVSASLERTSGDLVLAARTPGGEQRLLVGDFTGHGLLAAVGGPLVCDIFHSMTRKGLPMEEIVRECNHKVWAKMPVNIFMAATLVAVTPSGGGRIWNCAMPEVVRMTEGRLLERIPSTLPPLGITREVAGSLAGSPLDLGAGDSLFILSDGIPETSSPHGELYGMERTCRTLGEIQHQGRELDSILENLVAFRHGHPPHDDLTLVELRLAAPSSGGQGG